jgi:hypothetical protein
VEDRRTRVFGEFLIARMRVRVGRLPEGLVEGVSCESRELRRQSIVGASK